MICARPGHHVHHRAGCRTTHYFGICTLQIAGPTRAPRPTPRLVSRPPPRGFPKCSCHRPWLRARAAPVPAPAPSAPQLNAGAGRPARDDSGAATAEPRSLAGSQLAARGRERGAVSPAAYGGRAAALLAAALSLRVPLTHATRGPPSRRAACGRLPPLQAFASPRETAGERAFLQRCAGCQARPRALALIASITGNLGNAYGCIHARMRERTCPNSAAHMSTPRADCFHGICEPRRALRDHTCIHYCSVSAPAESNVHAG